MKKKVWIPLAIAVALCVCIIGGAVYIKSLFQPVNSNQTEMHSIEIPLGSSSANIATILADKQMIQNTLGFKVYTKLIDKGTLQAGTYELSPSMSMAEIVNVLKGGKVLKEAEYKLTIAEGLQLKEIAERIAKFTNQDATAILNQLNDKDFVQQMTAEYPADMTKGIFSTKTRYALEGYLYPATYFFHEEPSTLDLTEIVKPMLDETKKIYDKYNTQAVTLGFSFHELLTLSSIIEEEATAHVDREKISSVFHNRLEVSMPLQTDPTVLYAMDEHNDRVLYRDLEVDSPYNTYRVVGLPVGPIANAGESSIQAAVNPADTNYYYFLANKEGEVFFAEDFTEHKALKEKYIN